MEKCSQTLTRLMLGLFVLLLGMCLLFGAVLNWEHKSYPLAFLIALCLLLFLFWLSRRRGIALPLERLGVRRSALLLLGLCLTVNVLWAVTHVVEPDGDYVTFWVAACAQAENAPQKLHVYLGLFPHIMGYASFLGLFLRVFGCYNAVAVGVNILLTVLSCLWIFLVCLRWGGLRSAFWGGLLWALCPSAVMFNTHVLSEPFYTCLLLAYLVLVSGLEQREAKGKARLWHWILGGALAGLLLRAVNAARPIAAVFLIATGIWILLLRGTDLRNRRSWLHWGLFFLLLTAVYLPLGALWNAYLTQRLGEEPPPVPGYNMCVGFNTETGGAYSKDDMDKLQEYRAITGSAVEAQEIMRQKAIERIKSGEINFPRHFATKLRIFLGNDEGGAYYTAFALDHFNYLITSVVSNVFFYSVAMLAILSAWDLGRRKEQRVILLVPLYVIGLTLAQMLVEVSGRYHYSIIPMLIILAACFAGKETRRST